MPIDVGMSVIHPLHFVTGAPHSLSWALACIGSSETDLGFDVELMSTRWRLWIEMVILLQIPRSNRARAQSDRPFAVWLLLLKT